MGLRYAQLDEVLVAALGVTALIFKESLGTVLDAAATAVNFLTNVLPNEPSLLSTRGLQGWSLQGKIYFAVVCLSVVDLAMGSYTLLSARPARVRPTSPARPRILFCRRVRRDPVSSDIIPSRGRGRPPRDPRLRGRSDSPAAIRRRRVRVYPTNSQA